MPHISRDYIQVLWDETQDKSWLGFQHALERQTELTGSIENDPVRMMIHMSEDMENSGEPFPNNVDELHNVINENLGIELRERD